MEPPGDYCYIDDRPSCARPPPDDSGWPLRKYEGGARGAPCAALCAVVIFLLILAILGLAARRGGSLRADAFFTESAREEPTRSDVPYTGTVPFGTWGSEPWALAFHPLPDSGAWPAGPATRAPGCVLSGGPGSCPSPPFVQQGWTEGGGGMPRGYGWGVPPGCGACSSPGRAGAGAE